MDHLLDTEHENERIVLGLPSSVENDGERSQRRMAAELGIALGLVNAYFKRCIRKGLGQGPRRAGAPLRLLSDAARFRREVAAHGSVPLGLLLVFSHGQKRLRARLRTHQGKRLRSLVLAGKSYLAEIAILSAVETGVAVVALVDPRSEGARFVGVDVRKSFDEIEVQFEAVIVTDVTRSKTSFDVAVAAVGVDRVLAPALLGLRLPKDDKERVK